MKYVSVAMMVVVALVVGGCGSSGVSRLDTTTAGALQTVWELGEARINVKNVETSLAGLSGSDLRGAFKTFDESVSQLESKAERVRSRNAAMKARATEHQNAWEAEIAKINNTDAKAISTQRRAAFVEQFATVQSAMGELKSAYDPFVSDLKDLRLLLGNDLTPGGLAAAKGLIERSKAEAVTLQAKLTAVQTTVDNVCAETAVPTAPAK